MGRYPPHVCTRKGTPKGHTPNRRQKGEHRPCVEGISAFSWSSPTAQSLVQEVPYTLPTALWFQQSPHPLGVLIIKGQTLLAYTRSGNWTRAIGIQTKAAGIVSPSKNTIDTQDVCLSQSNTGRSLRPSKNSPPLVQGRR